MTRICITGGPRTGKTTLAGVELQAAIAEHGSGPESDPMVRHTDDLVHLGWSQASLHVAENWLTMPGPWIIEGVAVSRALRKWREAHPGEPPPVDRVIYLVEPYEDWSVGQRSMAKGIAKVHNEDVEPWLNAHGIHTEFTTSRTD